MAGLKDYKKNLAFSTSLKSGDAMTWDLPDDGSRLSSVSTVYSEGGVPANKATLIAAIPDTDFVINGDVFTNMKTADVLMLNDFYGFPFVAGILDFHYLQPNRPDEDQRQANLLIPSAYRSPQIRYNVAEGRTGNLSLNQYLLSEGVGEQGRNALRVQPTLGKRYLPAHYRKHLNVQRTGDANPNLFVYEGGKHPIRALHFKEAAPDSIKKITIMINEQDRIVLEDKATMEKLCRQALGNPQENVWSIPFELLGDNDTKAWLDPSFKGRDNSMHIEIISNDGANVDLLAEIFKMPNARGEG